MRIENFGASNSQANLLNRNGSMDSFSKNIHNQIANAQKQLQELSENESMNAEEKMKKREEIQQQITDLNNQLRQHQIEQRQQKQQAKKTSSDSGLNTNKNVNNNTGLSQSSMTAIISADSAISHARVQNNVADRLEARAGVLKSEIKLDSSRGGSVEAKQEELAEIEQRASKIQSEQMNVLNDTNSRIEKTDNISDISANKADKENDKTETNTDSAVAKKEYFSFGHMDARI